MKEGEWGRCLTMQPLVVLEKLEKQWCPDRFPGDEAWSRVCEGIAAMVTPMLKFAAWTAMIRKGRSDV